MQKIATKDLVNSIVAPGVFLTVALLGGIRIGFANREIQFLPPSLVTCLLGLLVLVSLFRAGVIRAGDDVNGESGLLGSLSRVALMIAYGCF